MSTDTNSGADVYPVKIRWNNDSATMGKLMTRQWEPTRDSQMHNPAFDLDDLDTIADCVWRRETTNIVIENRSEAELVVRFLRWFNRHTNNPLYGHIWASRQSHAAVRRRIEQIESAVGANEGHTALHR